MRIPGVPYVQGRNTYGTSTKYGIAIHNTSNDATAEGEASYATRRTDGTSAHLYVDNNSIIQSLDTSSRAGHAGSRTGNDHAVAVEITGVNGWTRAQWLERVAWDKLGAALAHVVRKYGIQVRRASVTEMKANPRVKAFYGHNDMRLAWGGTTHTDPGPAFPWDRLFSAVNAALGGTTTGEDDDVSATEVWGHKTTSAETGVTAPADAFLRAADGMRKVDVPRIEATLATIGANVVALAGRDWVDEQAVVDGVLAGLGGKNLDEAAAALQAAFGPERAAELGRLLAAGG